MEIGVAAFSLDRGPLDAVTSSLHDGVTILESPEATIEFIQAHSQAPAILICQPSFLPAEPSLLTSIEEALRHGWFRILAFDNAIDLETLKSWPSSITRHLILLSSATTGSTAEQLQLIAAQLDSEVLEATAHGLFLLYERASADDISLGGGGFTGFLGGLCQSLGATTIATYLLDGDGTHLLLDRFHGDPPPRLILWDWFDQQFVFQHVSRTYRLSTEQLSSLAKLTRTAAWPAGLVATFRVDGTPICVLFAFAELRNIDLKHRISRIAAREVFHLYRRRDIALTLDTLQQLSKLTSSDRDKSFVLWSMLALLKKHFYANGASLLEVIETDSDRVTFEKIYVHQARREKESFTEATGFAHYCVTHKKALVLTRTYRVDSKWFGAGTAYEPETLLAGTGTPVQLQAFVSPKAVEVERSVLYYPLMSRGEVTALLKIADFQQEYIYNIRHLKQIRTLSLPIASFLDDVNTIATLRARLDHEAENQKLVELANTLFLYREIALGMFHQVTNHTNRVESELMLIASIIESDKRPGDAGPHVAAAREVVREAKELIRKAQQRGRSLTPISQECLLVDEIVRPALKYIERDHPEITLKHSLTNNDYKVEVDPGYMREGLYNLLNNAIWAVKHNRGGKREIFVAVRPVDASMVRIHVEDSGIGIEADFRPSLFKPFATTRTEGGTGLGLYFAQQLVEHFGGRLELERSQPGRGSVFVITLPLKGDSNVGIERRNGATKILVDGR